MLLFPCIVLGITLGLERSHAQQGFQHLRALRSPRASGASSPFFLLQHNGGAYATSSFLLFLLLGLRQQRFGFAAGRNNPKEAKHSIFLSASELLHQLLVFHVGHGANGFVANGLDDLRVNICKQTQKNAPSRPILKHAINPKKHTITANTDACCKI